MLTQLNVIIGLLQSQGLGVEAINNWLGVIKKDVQQVNTALCHILLEDQVADLFTKSLDGSRFEYLRNAIGVCDLS